MVAGTFNLVIAQRLCRKACPHCSQKVNLSNHPMYLNALETFKEFDREALKNELISRGITAQLMDYTDDIKTLILDGKSAFEI